MRSVFVILERTSPSWSLILISLSHSRRQKYLVCLVTFLPQCCSVNVSPKSYSFGAADPFRGDRATGLHCQEGYHESKCSPARLPPLPGMPCATRWPCRHSCTSRKHPSWRSYPTLGFSPSRTWVGYISALYKLLSLMYLDIATENEVRHSFLSLQFHYEFSAQESPQPGPGHTFLF